MDGINSATKLKRHKLFEDSDMERKSKDDSHYGRITINVGGQRHETYLTTLRNHPDTRLYWITEQHYTSTKSPEYNAEKKEYFFDRHPGVFSHIVNYYRTGKLHCPMDVCGPLFEEELSFWGIDERQVELCCWENYKQHKDKQEKLKYFTTLRESYESDDEDEGDLNTWKIIKKKAITLLEKPSSSIPAKIITTINLLTFLIMVIQFCLTTLKSFRYDSHRTEILSGIRIFAVAWFILDLVLRLLFSPSLTAHFKKIINWLDLVSVCALVVHVKVHHTSGQHDISPFETLIFLKAVRLSKLLTFSFVIQVLANTLKASSRELCLLTIIVLFQAFAFSTVLFFIERNEITSNFESVPQSLWWAIITMTTVGYGDIKPTTGMGQILGCCCALCGVLVIALPVSVVATNFSLYYTYAKARLNLPPKADQKVPLPKELTSLKTKKEELGHSIINHSCGSIANKKHEPPGRGGSMESLLNEHDERPQDLSLHRSNSNEKKTTNPGTYEQNSPTCNNTLAETTDVLTPSFQELTFDFLDVPRNKRLKRSFLSNSISRVFGAKPHNEKPQERRLTLDVHSTYPLYSRRDAVTPGSVSSRSLSSTIYDSTSSNLPYCLRRSMEVLRNKQRLKRAGKWTSMRKCSSNAELHLVCFHRCNQHPEEAKTLSTGNNATTTDCNCKPLNLSQYPKPRNAKSCSELNDILHGKFRGSYYNNNNNDNFMSSGDISQKRSDSVQFGEIAITINGCSDDGLMTNGHYSSLSTVDSPRTNRRFLNPGGNCSDSMEASAGTR